MVYRYIDERERERVFQTGVATHQRIIKRVYWVITTRKCCFVKVYFQQYLSICAPITNIKCFLCGGTTHPGTHGGQPPGDVGEAAEGRAPRMPQHLQHSRAASLPWNPHEAAVPRCSGTRTLLSTWFLQSSKKQILKGNPQLRSAWSSQACPRPGAT